MWIATILRQYFVRLGHKLSLGVNIVKFQVSEYYIDWYNATVKCRVQAGLF